jgi:hypothetical protein
MGVWVGASLHSSSQPLSLTASGSTCRSCCNLLASIAKKSAKTQIAAPTSEQLTECAACLAGALVQDAPASQTVAAIELSTPREIATVLKTVRLSAHNHAHPPERGPPVSI